MARIGKEKKEEIRNKILEISKKMFFEDGYEKTSTSKIAKAVGIAEGTIFNYFKTKADILMEIISLEYNDALKLPETLDYTKGIVEIYTNYYKQVMGKVLILPKKMFLEIGMTILNATRKRPAVLMNLAALDFKFIEGLEELNLKFIDKGIMKPCDAKILAENIFAVIAYELMLYLYDKDEGKEEMHQNVEEKITFILDGRLL